MLYHCLFGKSSLLLEKLHLFWRAEVGYIHEECQENMNNLLL